MVISFQIVFWKLFWVLWWLRNFSIIFSGKIGCNVAVSNQQINTNIDKIKVYTNSAGKARINFSIKDTKLVLKLHAWLWENEFWPWMLKRKVRQLLASWLEAREDIGFIEKNFVKHRWYNTDNCITEFMANQIIIQKNLDVFKTVCSF